MRTEPKPEPGWTEQAERLAWRLSAREGMPFSQARDAIVERAIRLGRSPGNVKFRRMILKVVLRKGLPFREAASLVWDRLARSVIRRFVGRVKLQLEEKG